MYCPGCGNQVDNTRLTHLSDLNQVDERVFLWRTFVDCGSCDKSHRVLLIDKQTNDEDQFVLRDAMRTVVTHPVGLGIEIDADLFLDRLEDGRFRVCEYTPDGKTMTFEELFDDVDQAIVCYLGRRDLGLDEVK